MTNIPLKILTIDEMNNKSVTVTIEGEFLGNEEFSVYKLVDPTQTISIEAVDDSINPELNKKVIVTQELDLFEKNIAYVLKIVKGQEEVEQEFSIAKFAPPNRATIKTFGDRIVKIEFTTPIKNLAAQDRVRVTVTNPDTGEEETKILQDNLELRNFYFLYDSLNISGSDTSSSDEWLGLIKFPRYEETETILERISPNYVRVAPDFKSVEIQYNKKSIVTGKNKVIVHYSNNQFRRIRDYKDLTDFADPPRLVPVMTLEFDIAKVDHVGEAVECRALSRTELVVTYNEPVILLHTYRRGHLYVNGKPAIAKSVHRVGHEFNQIKFVLEPSSALSANFADVKINGIIDADGYVTGEYEFLNIPVVSIAPKIKSLVQVDPPDEKTTAIVALWSKEMKYLIGNPNMAGVVDNISNYQFLDYNNNEIILSKLNYNKETKELEIVTPKLDAGLYVLVAENVQDELGEKMLKQEIVINIEDRTIPKVTEVVYRFEKETITEGSETVEYVRVNSFVVKFDDIMNVTGEHSAVEPSNYLIEQVTNNESVRNILPNQTKGLAINNNKWMRFTIPEEYELLPSVISAINDNYLLHIGYPLIKKIRYVEDGSKNIYPLCNFKAFKKYEIIDISEGEKKIIANNKLRFFYTGDNELYSLSLGDFDFSIAGGKSKTAINIEKVDWKTIDFTFAQDTFDGNVTDVKIKVVDYPVSTDIFGASIKGGVSNTSDALNGLSPTIKAVSLISKETDNVNGTFGATLRFVFSKFMRIFNKEDIRITLNNSETPLIIVDQIKVNPRADESASVYEVSVKVPYSIGLNDIFMVSLANTHYIQSKDTSGNPLAPFSPLLVDKFIASNFSWDNTLSSSTLNGNCLEVVYNKPINPSSIINAIFAAPQNVGPQNQNGEINNTWDGKAYNIPAGKVIFENKKDFTGFIMRIDNFQMNVGDGTVDVSINIGTIKFYPNGNGNFIPVASGDINDPNYDSVNDPDPNNPNYDPDFAKRKAINTADATMTLVDGNKLIIEFDPNNEAALVDITTIAFAEYLGKKDIKDSENKNYLYEGYQPTHVF